MPCRCRRRFRAFLAVLPAALGPAGGVAAPLLAALPLSLAHAPAARAQTLREALALAYANNPTLLAARAQLRAVDENVPQALAGWRPTVVLSGAAGYADATARQPAVTPIVRDRFGNVVSGGVPFSNYVDISRDTLNLNATITQPIFRGGRTVAATRRAENQVLAQRARLLATEQQVLLDVVNAYVNLIRIQEEVRLNTNNEQVLTRQLQATNERFRVGEITRTDVAQAESRLAGARAQRALAEGQLQSARATFQRLVGVAPQRLVPPQPLTPPVRSQAEAGQLAAVNNPNVVAALFDEAAARDLIDVQFAALLPQVSVQGQVFRIDNNLQPHTRVTGSQVTANVSVPLYQGGAEHALVRQARQQAQQARQVVEDQRRQATAQASQAWETLVSARAQVDSNRSQIRAAEIALDGVQREAIVGSRTTLDVLNAEQELLNARVALVRALADVVNASHALAAAVGRHTARDLALPVQLYDMEAYYRAVRDRWFGTGDPSGAAETAQARAAADAAAPTRAAERRSR
ncbi:TolC family outer membrane protein [Caldovatus aquaticus]|uniref:TolC family outer membrane protein n=1 Tax=Caldovatus aquaticus TaxID=2865671 RepID=A0ABS7F3S5_9PROT|nr:TolC family outer membrane protein [Caldovatus aquaticus]MBW8269455.1 TolC family outer membrane protein [Caldovatus aquaticus]